MMNFSKFNTFENFGGGVLLSRKEASVRFTVASKTLGKGVRGVSPIGRLIEIGGDSYGK